MEPTIEDKFGIKPTVEVLPNTKENIMQELRIGEHIFNALEKMTVDEANELTNDGRYKWMKIHNASANAYFMDSDGVIQPVDPAGWY